MASSALDTMATAKALVSVLECEAKPFCITVDTYYKMAEMGLLEAGKRYELIHGVILERHSRSPQHGYSVKRLSDQLRDSLGETAAVFSQSPARLADDSEPQPDVLVLKPPKETYRERHPRPKDILLIIEVANTTLQTDRTLKLRLYASAGIPEYWLLNLQKNQLELYRRPDPDDGRYLELYTLSDGEVATFGECRLEWWR
ncbi:Uma2 family endonuclease [soil metagenome]